MKEVIAKRNKKSYVLFLVISIISIISGVFYMRLPDFKYVGIGCICVFSLIFLMAIVLLCSPNSVISREEDKLIIQIKFKKTIINVSDLQSVEITANPTKPDQIFRNSLTLIAIVDGVEKKFECFPIENTTEALTTLNKLIINK